MTVAQTGHLDHGVFDDASISVITSDTVREVSQFVTRSPVIDAPLAPAHSASEPMTKILDVERLAEWLANRSRERSERFGEGWRRGWDSGLCTEAKPEVQ